VISQRWIDALDEKSPHPSDKEIADFMVSLGFSRLEDSCYRWRRKSDGLIVFDTKPENFINSPAGVIPIDLLISER
jgi:hypothetical protein